MCYRASTLALSLAALVLACLLVYSLTAAPARAQSSDELAPTWAEQISRSEVSLQAEEAKLAEAEADLRQAAQDGSSYSYIDSRQDRVDHYEQSVAVEQARVQAAQKAQEKQKQLDRAGEPQGDVHELREVIVYYETLEAGAEQAGDKVTAEDAREELDGGVPGAGLRERLEVAEAEQAVSRAGETTAESTETEESTASTSAAPPPAKGGDSGGQAQPASPEPIPEPTPSPDAPSSSPIPTMNPATLVVFALLALGAAAYLVPRLPGAARVASRMRGALSHPMASRQASRKVKKDSAAAPEPAPEFTDPEPAPEFNGAIETPSSSSSVQSNESPERKPEGKPGPSKQDILERRRRDAEARKRDSTQDRGVSGETSSADLKSLFYPDAFDAPDPDDPGASPASEEDEEE